MEAANPKRTEVDDLDNIPEGLDRRPSRVVVKLRAAAAKRIGELTSQWGMNSIAIGSEFKKVRDTFPQKGSDGERRAAQHAERPGWREWITENTDWSPRQVNAFIRIAEEFGERELPTGISHRVLEYLAREHVPEEAREDVIGRIDGGEKIGRAEAEEIVAEHSSESGKAKKKRKPSQAAKRKAAMNIQANLAYHAETFRSKAEAATREWLPDEPLEHVVIEKLELALEAGARLLAHLKSICAVPEAEEEAE
jgi:hypothetical protein